MLPALTLDYLLNYTFLLPDLTLKLVSGLCYKLLPCWLLTSYSSGPRHWAEYHIMKKSWYVHTLLLFFLKDKSVNCAVKIRHLPWRGTYAVHVIMTFGYTLYLSPLRFNSSIGQISRSLIQMHTSKSSVFYSYFTFILFSCCAYLYKVAAVAWLKSQCGSIHAAPFRDDLFGGLYKVDSITFLT